MSATILWLTGWSMPDTVFDRLRAELPDFEHVSVDYSQAETPEEIFERVEYAAAKRVEQDLLYRKPLLVAGWSLGALLALRLGVQGFADGLVLFAGTARFTCPADRRDLGWPDAYVRQMIASTGRDRQAVEELFRRSLFTDAEWEAGMGEQLPPTGSWSCPALIAGLRILRAEDYVDRLPLIREPVFLVHGHDDKVCPYGAAEEIAARAAQVEIAAWAGCGHVPFLGREAEVAKAIRSWWHGQESKQDPASI
ncbi:alpha/beta fold hydrolase [Paenibacillus soyae]|uniref:Alpha/beta hydrolase n=1 Tax=Paenibacillus soyae TaxID=2969249 RepID=A0A9X2SBQ4_9BACL|nr:alpha/beta hydrolase [Paenibacillus soyae]MCR2805207.1 alpha/beta hydrolase [Paenibacillus soyae]